ncbi:MAG: MFS transporter [Paracoccaceae bacterium]
MTVSARKRIWGWYFFDWASQPYNTLLWTFIFSPYFAKVATAHYIGGGMAEEAAKAQAQALWGLGLTLSGLAIAVGSPILGAIADGSGRLLRWVWAFSVLYVVGAAGLWILTPDNPPLVQAVVLFSIGLIGMECATTFTNALLPDLGRQDEVGKISGSGFAFGYLGGVAALFIVLLFFAESGDTDKTLIKLSPAFGLDPATKEGTRFVGPFTALWYVLFMIPFFLWVKEPPRTTTRRIDIGGALARLMASLRGLGSRKSLAAYLASSMFYRDALNALYGFGGVYAAGVLNWSVTQIGIFGIVGAITAAAATWIGGRMDMARGPKPVIALCIVVLMLVCCIIVGMSRDSLFGMPLPVGSALPDIIFYVCGALIGAAGGALQASSRTLMVFHTSPGRAAESFGLYALSGKATAFLAPALITLATAATGSQRLGVSPLIALFLLGLVLLVWVKPKGEMSTR